MKSWLKAILVVVLVALAICTVVGCGGGGVAGPEDTVRGAFKAMEAKNAEKLGSYFTEDVREQIVSEAQAIFDIVDKISIANLRTKVLSQTEDAAMVEAEYDYEVTVFNETNKEHQISTIELVKVNGKWLITQPLEYELEG